MCHVVRDEDALPQPRGTGAQPDGERRVPRWVAGAAVMMAGGLAVAGWFDLQSGQTRPDPVLVQAAAVSVAAESLQATKGPGQGALPVNDEVPTAPGEVRKAAGHCEYGL